MKCIVVFVSVDNNQGETLHPQERINCVLMIKRIQEENSRAGGFKFKIEFEIEFKLKLKLKFKIKTRIKFSKPVALFFFFPARNQRGTSGREELDKSGIRNLPLSSKVKCTTEYKLDPECC